MSAPEAGETLARSTSLTAGILRYWLPVVVYVSVIFAVSSISNLTPPVRWSNADKFAHLGEYTALGFLLARAYDGTGVLSSRLANVMLAMVTGFVTGTLDELWQVHVPGRVSSHEDFLADAAGIVIGQLLYTLWARRPGR
jgi:VanZ family protein